jgi:predicted ATPase/DNA-binding CsgD family transcriptional regulator
MNLAGQARLQAAGVTPREAEVLTAIGRRLSNREIAERLVISVRTVESHVSALLRKLDLPDRPALVRLAQQLPARRVIRAPATSLVGRDGELARLAIMLTSHALVNLVGPAGCGKTRLALEAASRWPGQVRIIELSAATPRDVDAVIAGGLGTGYEARDLAAAAQVALGGDDVLVVVDNCEHVVGAAGAALAALAGVPGLHLLATSREPLGIGPEHVVPVGPLGVPAGPDVAAVSASDAGQLFMDRARAASSRFRLDETSAPHVAAICRRVDGLPLAIELAAARVRNLDVVALAEGLRDTIAVLERPSRDNRQRSLSSAIEWSWCLLGGRERDLLRRLAVLPGEFTLALAEAASPGQAAADVRSALMGLVEQSLVAMRLPEGEPARYRLLGVIRSFARDQPGPAVGEQVARAHARYFCAAAEIAVEAYYHPSPAGLAVTGFDEANLLAALAWSAAHDSGLASRLLVAVSRLTELEPSRPGLELIRDVATRSEPGWSSEALARAAVTVSFLSLGDAEQLARRSARAAATDHDRALASLAIGWVHAYRREESAAARALGRVIGYGRRTGDAWLEASALQARGIARSRPADAFADWEQSVRRFVVAGDLFHAGNVRYMLASRAVETLIRLEAVPVWLEECESFVSSQGLRHELAHIRSVRAGYERLQGHPGHARQLLDQVLPVFRQAGDFRCVARTLLELARPELTGDPATATGFLLESLRAAAIAGGPAMCAQVLADLAATGVRAGNLVLAARCAGALEALGVAPDQHSEPGKPVFGPALQAQLGTPAYRTFAEEGQAGGIELITALYPRGSIGPANRLLVPV